MMLKFWLSAVLLVGAGAAVAQAPTSAPAQSQTSTSPGAQPAGATEAQTAIQQIAMAFGQCVQAGMLGLPATLSPEAGAATVLGGCATQRRQLEQAAEAMIATMPQERQAGAREQLRTGLAEAETQISAAIRRQREAAATAPSQPPAQ